MGSSTKDGDVVMVLSAVCELLDKYGHIYAESEDPLSAFPRVRQELISKDRVPMPTPAKYHVVDAGPLGGAGPGHGDAMASGKQDSEQDVTSELRDAADEAREAVARFGKDDPRAIEQRGRFESLMARVQHLAQEAAENDDFEEYERLSGFIHKYVDMQQELAEGRGPRGSSTSTTATEK